jgi:type IV pilus assembly protein PilC
MTKPFLPMHAMRWVDLASWGLARSPSGQRPYAWTARRADGSLVHGQTQAGGDNQVRALLRRQGLKPLDVRPARAQRRAVRFKDLAPFTRQLATLLGAGMALLQCLKVMRQSSSHEGLLALMDQLLTDLEAGLSLSAALRKQPRVFSPLYAHMVEAGEASGQLDVLLERLAHDLEKTQALQSRVRSALMYPTAVLAVAVLVVAMVMVAVVPSFESVFASFGAELPWPTQWVMALSRGLVSHGAWWLLTGLALGAGALHQWRRSEPLRRRAQALLFCTPVWGPLMHQAAVARWSRTLSGLLAAGLPLVDAMASVKGAAGFYVYADACDRLRDELARGSSLQAALSAADLFSPVVLQMCAVGEESGALDHMLAKVAETHEREVDDRVAGLSSLLEPVIIVFLGLVIGALVLALYLPIFQMGQIT